MFTDAANIPEGIRGIEAIKNFILANPGRLQDAVNDDSRIPIRNLAGYTTSEYYLFTDEGFNEAYGGCLKSDVMDELIRLGLLFRNEGTRPKSKHPIGSGSKTKRIRFYAIKSKILEHEFTHALAESV